MIVFDMVVKYLRYSGYEVTHITNFTDVDDKIINRAKEDIPFGAFSRIHRGITSGF